MSRKINVHNLFKKNPEVRQEQPQNLLSVQNLQEQQMLESMNLYLLQNSKHYVQMIGEWELEWNILKKEIEVPFNGIFSMSFYRKKGYNSSSPEFLVYKNGLKERINEIIRLMNTRYFGIGIWKIRIYYERSVKDDIIEILNLPILKENNNLSLIELFEYFYAPLSNNRLHHYDSFGMFMRLLPLILDKDNNDELQATNINNSNIKHYFPRVLVLDIDRKISYNRKLIIKKYLYDESIQLGYEGREGNTFYTHLDCYENNEESLNFWPIVNHFIYQYNIYYPYNLFIDFFNNSMDLWFRNNETGRQKYKRKCMMNVFGYGYDEYFTNNYMLNYYLNQNKKIELYIKLGFFGLIYGLLNFIIKNSLQNDDNIRQFYTDILMLFSYKNKLKKLTWDEMSEFGIRMNIEGNRYIGDERYLIGQNYKKYKTSKIDLMKFYQEIRKLKSNTPFSKKIYEIFHLQYLNNLKNNEDITENPKFPHNKMFNLLNELIIYIESLDIIVPQRFKNSLCINRHLSNQKDNYYFIKATGRRDIKLQIYEKRERETFFRKKKRNQKLYEDLCRPYNLVRNPKNNYN